MQPIHIDIDVFRIKLIAIVAIAVTTLNACAPTDEENDLQAIRARGEQFLSLLKAQQWREATEMVLLNDAAYHRFSLPKQSDPAALKNEITKVFKRTYTHVKPGAVVSVRIDAADKTFASITYRHDDLDRFHMRLSNGEWYYSFE